MLKRDRYTINHHGLALGSHQFTFEFGDDFFVEFEGAGIEGGSGKVEIELTKHSSMMELDVTIQGEVSIECDRCVELYSQPVNYNGEVVVKISEHEGEYDGDIIWLSPREDRLDLTEWIFESIVLSLPLQRVHQNRDECNAEALKYITGTVELEDEESQDDQDSEL